MSFETADQVYDVLGGLMQEIIESPGFQTRLRLLDQTVQFRILSPTATITVALPAEGELSVDYGRSGLTPDLILRLSAAAADGLFGGDLNIFLARDSGEVEMQGSHEAATRFIAVLPQLRQFVAPLYRVRSELGAAADEPRESSWLIGPTMGSKQ